MDGNKTVLVTGGAVRVGKAISLFLAEKGYNVAIHYHSSKEQAEKTKAKILELGTECEIFQADLGDASQCTKLIMQVKEQFKTLSVLVNNAAIFKHSDLLETNEDLFDEHMGVNFKAPFFLTQKFAQTVKKGNVINILDTYIAKKSNAFFTYLLSKKILAEFTKLAAKRLAPDIRVNAVAPGSLLPALEFGEDYLKNKKNTLPLNRLATLEEVASAVFSFIQNQAITGQIIFVDSGEHIA